jgi:hypothetical protein
MADRICQRLSAGESLFSICADGKMPADTTVYVWLAKDEGFRDKYARAREEQAERYAEQIIEIADDSSDDANSRRVRVDARKWVASKLLPKKYGDRTRTEHTGAVNVTITGDDAAL